jgi:cell division FtsZ-interacting protein ZapD
MVSAADVNESVSEGVSAQFYLYSLKAHVAPLRIMLVHIRSSNNSSSHPVQVSFYQENSEETLALFRNRQPVEVQLLGGMTGTMALADYRTIISVAVLAHPARILRSRCDAALGP